MTDLPIQPSSSGDATTKTLRNYRRAVARELGIYAGPYTTSSASTDADSAAKLISTTLIDTNVQPSYWDLHWVWITSGALDASQRRVRDGSLVPSVGSLTVSRAFASTPQAGITFELYKTLPPHEAVGRLPSLTEVINEALKRIEARIVLSIAGNGDASLSLAAYPYLTRTEQIVRLLDPNTDSNWYQQASSRTATIRQNGADYTLELSAAYASGETFGLEVLIPAFRWINGAASTVGLALDTDTALPELLEVGLLGATYAAQRLKDETSGPEKEAWTAKWLELLSRANRLDVVRGPQGKGAHAARRGALAYV